MQYPNNDDLKRFFKKSALLVITLIILDSLIGAVFKHYYFKQKSGLLYRTTFVIDSTRAGILVFGSSRANHHYIPSLFEKKLHTTFYNCGRDGCNLIYHAALISAVLERYTPKRIIIDLNLNDLGYSEEGKLSPLLPYHNNPAVNAFIKYNGKFENYKLLSKIYPYNSLLTNIIVGNLSFNKSRFTDDKGYVKLDKVMPSYQKEPFKPLEIINSRVDILNELLKKLSAKHIKTTIVVSPAYYIFAKDDPTIKIVEKLSRKYKYIDFFNYENDPAFNGHELYEDSYHLNSTGAYKFSEDLADKLIKNK